MATAIVLLSMDAAWAAENGDIAIEALSFEDLMQMEVSSVSRKTQTLSQTAAAAFVITQDDIRRSGATSIPEALRLAPGLEVAQIGNSGWAITARGFNGYYANKLLVLMDGRTVYTPIFSGVFWNLQDAMMEDIERIEVIRGPGAVMWGANAVNGVINIITKKSKDTRGNLVVAGAGNQERGFAGFRHGGKFGGEGDYRIYGKGFERASWVDATGVSQDNAWHSGQLGFRTDSWLSNGNLLVVQGDVYRVSGGAPLRSNAVLTPPYTSYTPHNDTVNGGNLRTQWSSDLANGGHTSVQAYFDRVQFTALAVTSAINTTDLDFQHQLQPGAVHDLMWGVNYRNIDSKTGNTSDIAFSPADIRYHNSSIFIQDDITVAEHVRLTLGAKEEKPRWGGAQLQPNARLLWTPNTSHSIWLGASKASRTPSIGESLLSPIAMGVVPPSAATLGMPTQLALYGNPNLLAEKVTSYEIGLRSTWTPNLTSDIAAFSNRYDNLIEWSFVGGAPTPVFVATPVPHLEVPMVYRNAAAPTRTHGLEISAGWKALEWMRLETALTYLKINAPQWDGLNYDAARLAPRTQESLRCITDLTAKTQFDITLRHVGALTASTQGMPAYTATDMRLGYKPQAGLDLSLVGRNLFAKRHAEFMSYPYTPVNQIPRSIFAKVTWSY